MRHFPIDVDASAITAENPFVATIKLGETVTVESANSGNRDLSEGFKWGGPRFDKDAPRRITRPSPCAPWRFMVDGVRAGDWIAIHFEDIQPVRYGYVRRVGPFIRLDGAGVVEVRDGRVYMPGGVSVPARPMLGSVGLAAERDPRPVGVNGGNMDNPDLVAGTILHIKAQRYGGLLDICDCHAVQGDGEVPGAGVEIEATTRFRVERSEGFNCRGPVLETPDEWQTYGVKPLWEDAVKWAFYEMVQLVKAKFGLSELDAQVVVGTCADPRACGVYALPGLNLNVGGLASDAIMRVCLTKDIRREA